MEWSPWSGVRSPAVAAPAVLVLGVVVGEAEAVVLGVSAVALAVAAAAAFVSASVCCSVAR